MSSGDSPDLGDSSMSGEWDSNGSCSLDNSLRRYWEEEARIRLAIESYWFAVKVAVLLVMLPFRSYLF